MGSGKGTGCDWVMDAEAVLIMQMQQICISDHSDSSSTEAAAVNEPVSTPPVAEVEPEAEDNSHSDRLSQARKELAEYDDLDV